MKFIAQLYRIDTLITILIYGMIQLISFAIVEFKAYIKKKSFEILLERRFKK